MVREEAIKPKYNSRPLLIALISFVITLSISVLKSSNLEWETVSVEKITTSDVLPFHFLLAFRWCATILVLSVAAWSFFDPEGLLVQTKYLPESSLSSKAIMLKGKSRCATFTVWNWYLIGIYFLLTSLVSSFVTSPPIWLLRTIWILYEIAFGCAILVTVVVTFILLPARAKFAKEEGEFDFMLKLRPVLMHNANVFLMSTELIVNNLPVKLNHVPFTALWGCMYCVFAWIWQARTGVYFYPFLDHTLRWWKAMVFHVGLITALMLFHMMGVAATSFSLETYPIGTRLVIVYSVVALITKIR
jgi:hypothetical protein